MSVIQTMRRIGRLAVLAGALGALSPSANAQQPPAGAMAAAKELVEVTGATTLFNPLIPGVVEQARLLFLQQNPMIGAPLNEVAAKVRAEVAPRFVEISNEVARLYATDFTEQDLKTIIAFYRSPAGKKLLEQQPKVAEAGLRFAQDWANKLSDQVIGKMREELKKRGLQ
jgi:uncharacterized protein